MKVTKTEEVTRTYCDVCGNEVTGRNNTSSTDDDHPENEYTVCMDYNQFHLDMNSGKSLQLSCETLARLYTEYAHLANTMFLTRND